MSTISTLAVWLWQSRAWTEPQSVLSEMWIGVQWTIIVGVPFFLFAWRAEKKNSGRRAVVARSRESKR